MSGRGARSGSGAMSAPGTPASDVPVSAWPATASSPDVGGANLRSSSMSGRGARSGSGASSGSGAKPMCPAVSSPLSPEGRGCVPSGGDQRKSSLLMGSLYHTRVLAGADWPPRPRPR